MVSGLDNAGATDESGEAESKIGGVGGDIAAQSVPTSGLPCAFVVGVLTRNWRDYVCSCVPREGQEDKDAPLSSTPGWIVATPWDRRIPRIRIFTTEPSKLAGMRCVRAFTSTVLSNQCRSQFLWNYLTLGWSWVNGYAYKWKTVLQRSSHPWQSWGTWI